MDVSGQPSSSASGQPPPIPRQTRQHSRRKEGPAAINVAATSRHADRPGTANIAPASPEVISSLITSLSVISKPASNHFDGPASLGALSDPSSPFSADGSFGVDYGAFTISAGHDETGGADADLDQLAASSPVVRTSKPPSGFSPLTAPKVSPSPRESGGLKSILTGGRSTTSRPSSKGSSLASRDADTQSIGNLSIERGPASPASELRHQKSQDSWGIKMAGRATKGLMYMSSKERLRDREERKRASVGAAGSERLGSVSPRPKDPFLAETAISEEPSPHNEVFAAAAAAAAAMDGKSSMDAPLPSPRPIPARDSSLRKTGQNAKRSSRRSSKRNSGSDIIHELDEFSASKSSHKHESSRRRHHGRDQEEASRANSDPVHDRSKPGASTSRHHHHTTYETNDPSQDPRQAREGLEIEDGAPFPAVAQGRRRDRSWEPGRQSDRQTPEPGSDGGVGGGVKPKRSSTRLKRLSGPLSPRPDEKAGGGPGAGPGDNGKRQSNPLSPTAVTEMTVGYERPQSADSIDDAVESYLCSPRLSQKIRHPQTGRVISFSEVGDAEGSAVFCCVGMGLTRYITAFYDELALTLKLRLITPDRPGVGDSESYADGTSTPLSWPGEQHFDPSVVYHALCVRQPP